MSLWLMPDFGVAAVLSRLRWPDLANWALPPSALGDVFLDSGEVVFVEAPAKLAKGNVIHVVLLGEARGPDKHPSRR